MGGGLDLTVFPFVSFPLPIRPSSLAALPPLHSLSLPFTPFPSLSLPLLPFCSCSNDGTTLYVVTPDNMDVYAERNKIKAIKDKVKANKYLRDPDNSDT